ELAAGGAGQAAGLPCHTGLVLHSPRGSALGRVQQDKTVRLVRGDREAFGLHGRSAEQRIALDLLLDDSIGIVSLGGRAGTGKSALALCAGLEMVMERRRHRKVVVFRPLYAVGGQDLGYLPGSESEEMAPWGQAVFDTLGALVSQNVLEEVIARGMLEVLPLTHLRVLSLHAAFVIVVEAQSLERNVFLTVLCALREARGGLHTDHRAVVQLVEGAGARVGAGRADPGADLVEHVLHTGTDGVEQLPRAGDALLEQGLAGAVERALFPGACAH